MSTIFNSGLELLPLRTFARCFFLQRGQLFSGFRRSALTHEVAKRKDERIGNRVDATGALLAPGDETTFEQQIQMLGDVWLIGFKILYQLGNCLFRFGKRLEDSEPKRLAKIAKAPRNQFQRPARKGDFTHGNRVSLYAHIVDTVPGAVFGRFQVGEINLQETRRKERR